MNIGLIDHHLHNWHSDVFLKILNGPIGEGDMNITIAYESDPVADKEDWCKINKVKKASSPEEVVEKADAIFVMAPDNIEDHLKLGRCAYESGKQVYVDKYLSTSIADAKEIVRLCKASGSPLTSNSSLRFTPDLLDLMKKLGGKKPKEVFARGYGHWHPYAIHTVTRALPIFGTKADRIINTGTEDAPNVTIADGERRCNIQILWAPANHWEVAPWQVGAIIGDRIEIATNDPKHDAYEDLMREAVKFLRTRISPLSVEEMLMTSIIDELGEKSREMGGVWIDIPQL